MQEVSLEINGKKVSREIEDHVLLSTFLRDIINLTGTHIGCDTSQCGACVVHVDGKSVKSCTLLVADINGSKVTTIEGLATNGKLHPMQEAFKKKHGLQCGFCTPGFIMQTYNFLKENPKPTEKDIRLGVSGNLCRCTGYQNIVKAISKASKKLDK